MVGGSFSGIFSRRNYRGLRPSFNIQVLRFAFIQRKTFSGPFDSLVNWLCVFELQGRTSGTDLISEIEAKTRRNQP